MRGRHSNIGGKADAPAVLALAPRGPVWLALALLWLVAVCSPLMPLGNAATREAGEVCAHLKPSTAPSWGSHFGTQQHVAADSPDWQIRLARWQPAKWPAKRFVFRLSSNRTGEVFQLRFSAWLPSPPPLRVSQIDQVDFIDGQRALILGRIGADSSVADVVALPSGTVVDHFMCLWPALSPDHHFLAFVKPFPGHPGPVSINYEYLVYDLLRSPAYNRPSFKPGIVYDAGWPVYPPGATNASGESIVPGIHSLVHTLSSGRLFWLNSHTLAFTDSYPPEDSLIVVSLAHGIKAANTRAEALNASEIVDMSRCKRISEPEDYRRWAKDPAGLIRVDQISAEPDRPGWVCLRFAPGPCVARKYMAVRLP